MIELQAGRLTARISPRGAELQSLRRGGEELLWQPQPGVWHQTAPWLFPFVGRLLGGGFEHRRRWYEMPLHGFAAGMDFSLLWQQPEAARMVLKPSDATRASYPFEFRLEVGYRLDDAGLAIDLSVHNEGDEVMPFALGGHPGFALPGPLEDWHLGFADTEANEVWRLQPEPAPWGLRASAPEPCAWASRGSRPALPLRADLFQRDALILDPVRSPWVALVHREHGERLRLHLGGAPTLGLWARPGAPFICIEPWWGRDDDAAAPQALLAKPQLHKLPAGQAFEAGLRISVARGR